MAQKTDLSTKATKLLALRKGLDNKKGSRIGAHYTFTNRKRIFNGNSHIDFNRTNEILSLELDVTEGLLKMIIDCNLCWSEANIIIQEYYNYLYAPPNGYKPRFGYRGLAKQAYAKKCEFLKRKPDENYPSW